MPAELVWLVLAVARALEGSRPVDFEYTTEATADQLLLNRRVSCTVIPL